MMQSLQGWFEYVLEGQYIIKNVVLICSGIVIGATVRGGAVVADLRTAQAARQVEKS